MTASYHMYGGGMKFNSNMKKLTTLYYKISSWIQAYTDHHNDHDFLDKLNNANVLKTKHGIIK